MGRQEREDETMKFQAEKSVTLSGKKARELGLSDPVVGLVIGATTVAVIYERAGREMGISWEPAEPAAQSLGVASARRAPLAFVLDLLNVAKERDMATDAA